MNWMSLAQQGAPPVSESGLTESLANLSVGAVVLIALVFTILRLILVGPRDTSPIMRGLGEILESFTIALVLVFLIIRPFFVQAFFIPSPSMEPTLLGHNAGFDRSAQTEYTDTVHDHIFVNKLVYRLGNPQHGDIIVFRAPKHADQEAQISNREGQENILIKRLIGLPGDTIEVKEGAVYRNGKKLNESYIKEAMDSNKDASAPYAIGQPLKLGPSELFVMGDNRNNSNDSRFWGTLPRNRVIGKAALIFWPLNRVRFLR